MNLSDIPFWKERIEAMKEFDDGWVDIIQGIQNDVWQEIIRYFTRRVKINSEGNVGNTPENILLVSGIDRVVAEYLNARLVTRTVAIGSEIDKLLSVNKKYYAAQAQSNFKKTVLERIAREARGYVLDYIGGEVVKLSAKAGSLLSDALTNTRFTRAVKAVIMDAVTTEKPVDKTAETIEHYGKTNTNKLGEYEKQVYNVLPDPGGVIENVYGLTHAIEMGLHFTRYQGGIIKTSRPFCIERNNKIFHVSQVAKFGTPADTFGGYKNKSQGEFQGKPRVYNPFYHLGGHNCRHRYFYISNEYAFRIDPKLKDIDWELPEFFKPAT